MSVNLTKVFKSFLPSRWKEKDSHKHHHNPKIKSSEHDQEVIGIMKLMPIQKFDDGIMNQLFL